MNNGNDNNSIYVKYWINKIIYLLIKTIDKIEIFS